MLPRAIHPFNANPIKIPSTLSKYHQHCVRRNNPKMCMEPEKTLNSQRNVEKENQTW